MKKHDTAFAEFGTLFSAKDPTTGANGFLTLAAEGRLGEIQFPENLSLETVGMTDFQMRNMAHLAAQNGHLRQIPDELLTPQVLLTPDFAQKSALAYAREFDAAHPEAKAQATPDIEERCEAFVAAWLDAHTGNPQWLHAAANDRLVSLVPSELLGKGALSRRDERGQTALHVAAKAGTLDLLPQPAEVMLSTDAEGNTVLDLAEDWTGKKPFHPLQVTDATLQECEALAVERLRQESRNRVRLFNERRPVIAPSVSMSP